MALSTKDIFVFIQQHQGVIAQGSLQLLAKARQLVQEVPSFDVVGVVMGHDVHGVASAAFEGGADKVILVDSPRLAHYSTQHYCTALTAVIREHHPDSLLLSATIIGRDLAPRVAARVNTGLTADATQIEVDTTSPDVGTLLVTRPAFGGNLFGTIICPHTRPQMSTIRPHVFDTLKNPYQGRRELLHQQVSFEASDQVRTLRRFPKMEKTIDLSKAHVILSGGRGVQESYDLLVKTAGEIGAAPASSRALVDAGVAPKALQVGQTGTTVRPRVYIALGISGAVQHTAGMENADLIIAVNTDPGAAIFQIAHVGLVADGRKVLPLLKDELRKAASK